MRHLMKHLAVGGLLSAMWLAAPAIAVADTITTFDASGTFDNGSVMSGTVTIDVTTGAATGADINIAGPSLSATLDYIHSSGADYFDDNSWTLVVSTGQSIDPYIFFYIDTSAAGSKTLVGYAGGPLYSNTMLGSDGGSTFINNYPNGYPGLVSGSFSPETDVPEPATYWLMVVGVTCIVGARMLRGGRPFGLAPMA